MSEPLEKKVDESLDLARQNRKILGKLLYYRRFEAVLFGLKIVVFVVVAFGLFYYLEPFLGQLMEIYNNFNSVVGNLPGF